MRRFRSFARSVGVDPRDFAALSPFGGCDPGDLSRYAADMAELHFCTVCGVSVPQAEVDSGNAVVQGERSVCPDCMGLLGVVEGGRSSGGGGGLVAFFLAVIALGGAGYVWWDGDQARQRLREDTADTLEVQAKMYAGTVEDKIQEVLTALQTEMNYMKMK